MNTDQQNSRYNAYSNYLFSVSKLIEQEHLNPQTFAKNICGLAGFNRITRATSIAEVKLTEALRQCWFTELLLHEKKKYPALLPYAAPWSMVECYYAVYPAIRAYFLALGRNVETTHQATLKTVSNDLLSLKDRFPSPWRCVLKDDPSVRPCIFVNSVCDKPEPIDLKNPLISPSRAEPCQFYGLLLKTTRERMLEKQIRIWKHQEKRKRIRGDERIAVISKLRPTTIFDALYRIRTRANYQDIDSFVFSQTSEPSFELLHESMCNIAFYTLKIGRASCMERV